MAHCICADEIIKKAERALCHRLLMAEAFDLSRLQNTPQGFVLANADRLRRNDEEYARKLIWC